jgi:hypothetical protein
MWENATGIKESRPFTRGTSQSRKSHWSQRPESATCIGKRSRSDGAGEVLGAVLTILGAGMRISRVVIRNFRSFALLDVPINGNTTCVIGENNTGKSNFTPYGYVSMRVFPRHIAHSQKTTFIR